MGLFSKDMKLLVLKRESFIAAQVSCIKTDLLFFSVLKYDHQKHVVLIFNPVNSNIFLHFALINGKTSEVLLNFCVNSLCL